MKKAFLVEFNVRTRVLLDESKDPDKDEYAFAELVRTARKQMLDDNIENYLCGDNAQIEEDIECPYDHSTED